MHECNTSRPHLLFLSHCVPNPPDKGEKIRAYHQLARLARDYSVHLACFARTEAEMQHAQSLQDRCASVYSELLPFRAALLRAGVRFALGESLNASFYGSARLARHVRGLRNLPLAGTFVYSGVMMQYAPARLPILLDMVDVDSEKWAAYGKQRRPGALYSLEARRLRNLERDWVARADRTFVSTGHEQSLLEAFAGPATSLENGVDFDFFDPAGVREAGRLRGRRYIVFTGAMDYFPNVDGVSRFARDVFPVLRRQHPGLEFLIVGHNPPARVMSLERIEGVTVTGSVPDVRPYLAGAWAAVVPLRIARGIQNKVLEALAMDKPVLASPSVCRTFGPELPEGVVCCESPADYLRGLALPCRNARRFARARFNWAANVDDLADIVAAHIPASASSSPEGDSLGQNPEPLRCATSADSPYRAQSKRK